MLKTKGDGVTGKVNPVTRGRSGISASAAHGVQIEVEGVDEWESRWKGVGYQMCYYTCQGEYVRLTIGFDVTGTG